MKNIPTQIENPTGLHQRYVVKKLVKRSNVTGIGVDLAFDYSQMHEQDTDPNAEYFVMRLDEGGKDREHIKACRIGIHAYAAAIEHHIPELAKDLRERYHLLP